jgi:hypothetical protein
LPCPICAKRLSVVNQQRLATDPEHEDELALAPEVAEGAKEVQGTWSARERALRSCMPNKPYEFPQGVHIPGSERQGVNK